jgi:hypothetical protein
VVEELHDAEQASSSAMQVRQAIGSEQRHERMENDVWCGAGSEKIGGENKKSPTVENTMMQFISVNIITSTFKPHNDVKNGS